MDYQGYGDIGILILQKPILSIILDSYYLPIPLCNYVLLIVYTQLLWMITNSLIWISLKDICNEVKATAN